MDQSGPNQDRNLRENPSAEDFQEVQQELRTELKSEAKSQGKGCLVGLVGTIIGGVIGAILVTATFNPWAYYIGGRWTMFSGWEGYGKMHSSTGLEYGVYVTFEQYSTRRHSDRIRGKAVLCTPSGTTYEYDLDGHVDGAWLYTEGKQTHISLHSTKSKIDYGFILDGVWRNGSLVLNDGGSVGKPFHADGAPDVRGRYSWNPMKTEHAEVTVNYGNRFDFDEMCNNDISKGR